MVMLLVAGLTAVTVPSLEVGWTCHLTNQVREAHRTDLLTSYVRHGPYFDQSVGGWGHYKIAYEDAETLVMTWVQPWNDGGVHTDTISIAKGKSVGVESYSDTSRPEDAMIAEGECVPF